MKNLSVEQPSEFNKQTPSGVVIIIIQNNKYLLVKQNKQPYKDCWAPVHGTIEPNETEENAVIRETLEEIGLAVEPIKKLGITKADYKVKDLHWWLAAYKKGEINIDHKEISECGYFSKNELLNLKLLPMTKEFFLTYNFDSFIHPLKN